jgi:hypothetical protein
VASLVRETTLFDIFGGITYNVTQSSGLAVSPAEAGSFALLDDKLNGLQPVGQVKSVPTAKAQLNFNWAATSLIISNLVIGGTYYFAATTYSTVGAESALPSEVLYTVPTSPLGLQLGRNLRTGFNYSP